MEIERTDGWRKVEERRSVLCMRVEDERGGMSLPFGRSETHRIYAIETEIED